MRRLRARKFFRAILSAGARPLSRSAAQPPLPSSSPRRYNAVFNNLATICEAPACISAMDVIIESANTADGTDNSNTTTTCGCRAACGLGGAEDMGICLAVASDDPATALQTPTTAYPNGYLGEMCFTKQPACEQYLDAQSGTTTVSGTCGLVRTISIVIIVVPIVLVVLIACCVALCIWCCCCRKKKAVGP